ncbi:hypothetical protein JCM11641_003617 [Rhodosporidiobolus odoratus]
MDSETGLPLAFGKRQLQKKAVDLSKLEATKRKQDAPSNIAISNEDPDEALPARANPAAAGGGAEVPRDRLKVDNEGQGEDDGDDQVDRLPVTHEVEMKDHVKTVSALSLDPSGTRLISGSYDYDVKLWDFGGMKGGEGGMKSFRGFEARAGHQASLRKSRWWARHLLEVTCLLRALWTVTDVQWSSTGSEFLVANGSTEVKLYDRDGAEVGEFNKGDMYIRDLRNTDGHVAAVTSVSWHPTQPTTFLTLSSDSSLRIWSTTARRKSASVLVVRSKAPGKGGKTKVTTGSWSPDGKLIAAVMEDGSVHVWRAGAGAKYNRSDYTGEKGHEEGTWTSGLAWSPDGKRFATRGGDGTVKLWNPKSLKTPLASATSLPSLNQETNLIFSPSGRYILTGTAGSKAGVVSGTGSAEEESTGVKGKGKVVVLNSETLETVRKIEISDYSVVKVLWHPKINQILASTSAGSIHVLYSPSLSLKGVLLSITRPTKRPQIDDFTHSGTELDRPIIAPHSLPMFKDDGGGVSAGGRGGKRKRERERMDGQKTMKPLPPVTGPGKGGRIGAAATQHVVQGLVRNTLRDVDPREALLKYATADPEDNTWTKAWAKTQPKAVFDNRPEEEGAEGGGEGKK